MNLNYAAARVANDTKLYKIRIFWVEYCDPNLQLEIGLDPTDKDSSKLIWMSLFVFINLLSYSILDCITCDLGCVNLDKKKLGYKTTKLSIDEQ